MRPALVMLALALAAMPGAAAPAMEATEAVEVSGAWSPPVGRGEDAPLYMSIRGADAADALVRARCEAANFVELQTVDEGEGFPTSRVVKSIPVEARGVTELRRGSFHVMLLQARQALGPGATFGCGLTFRVSGKVDVVVTVREPD